MKTIEETNDAEKLSATEQEPKKHKSRIVSAEESIARFNKKYDENKQYIDNILNSRQYK